jgi:hypothetical protein
MACAADGFLMLSNRRASHDGPPFSLIEFLAATRSQFVAGG